MNKIRHWIALCEAKTDKPYIDAHKAGAHAIEIEMMFVPDAMRGKGVGRATYEKWEAKLPKNIHLVTAWAADTDGEGKSTGFWEAMGFSLALFDLAVDSP